MCRCFYRLIDKLFLGHYIRPLFVNKDNNAATIRDGLTNTVVTAGVVGALIFSMTVEAAMSSKPEESTLSTIASFFWYSASGTAVYSVLTSTLAAVALAITPENRIYIIGRKLLYCWVLPFLTTIMSVLCMGLGMWSDAESQRLRVLEESFNITGTEAITTFQHGGIVIWSVRVFFITTLFVGTCLTVFVVFCGERIERLTGIESTTGAEERQKAQSLGNGTVNKEESFKEEGASTKILPTDGSEDGEIMSRAVSM